MATVTVKDANGNDIAGAFSIDAADPSGKTVVFTPSAPLPQLSRISFSLIGGGVKSMEGAPLQNQYDFAFDTASAAPRPVVVSTNPHGNAQNVDLSTAAKIEFSEPMDASSFVL